MAVHQVLSYSVHWDLDGHFGKILVSLSNGVRKPVSGQTPQEMMMLVDVLRHESPVFFDDTANLLMLGSEPVGEAEA